MGAITAIRDHRDHVRAARAHFVAEAIDNDDRSHRWVAQQIGISHSALGERVKGRVSFTAEDIEGIARILKRDPVEFYGEYLAAAEIDPRPENPGGGNNGTFTASNDPKQSAFAAINGHLAPVIPINIKQKEVA